MQLVVQLLQLLLLQHLQLLLVQLLAWLTKRPSAGREHRNEEKKK